MVRSVTFLFIVALAAAVLVGCGDSDDGGSSSGSNSSGSNSPNSSTGGGGEAVETSSLTKSQFIKQANEICAKDSEDLLVLIANYMSNHPKRPEQSQEEVTAEGVRRVLLPRFQSQIDEIRALGAPAGDEKQTIAFLDAMQSAVDSLDERNEVSLVTDIDREFRRAGKLGRGYGIQACAS